MVGAVFQGLHHTQGVPAVKAGYPWVVIYPLIGDISLLGE